MGRVCLYLCFSVKQKLASFLNPATENFHRHIECTWYRQTSTSFVLGIKERGKKLLIWNEQQIQTQIHNSRYKKPQSNKCYIATRLFILHMPMIQSSHWCQIQMTMFPSIFCSSSFSLQMAIKIWRPHGGSQRDRC